MAEDIDRERIADLVAQGQTIRAIQEVMERTGLSLKEARDLVSGIAPSQNTAIAAEPRATGIGFYNEVATETRYTEHGPPAQVTPKHKDAADHPIGISLRTRFLVSASLLIVAAGVMLYAVQADMLKSWGWPHNIALVLLSLMVVACIPDRKTGRHSWLRAAVLGVTLFVVILGGMLALAVLANSLRP